MIPHAPASIDDLQSLADDPSLLPEQRSVLRGAVRQLEQARVVAIAWGGDEHAELRVSLFENAVTDPDSPTEEKIALGLALDELCRTVGVPMEGTALEASASARP